MIDLTLDSGYSLTVSAYEYSRTYASLMEGVPDARVNQRILENEQRRARTLWGERKVHLVAPEMDCSEPAHPNLPGSQYIAWLTCYDPVNPKFQASELVVLFYSNLTEDTPISRIVQAHLHHLKWEDLAHDFDW